MLNKVILQGRLTADPELRQTPNGISVAAFSIAVARDFAAKGTEKQTDFINIVAWRQTAEFINKYFKKGSMIIAEGSIQTRNYEDKNGNKRTAFEVVASNVYFGESKNENARGQEQAENSQEVSTISDFGEFEEVETDDDLPF